ncbi:hypothetical protein JHK82_024683 [Glycine max]|nr:hypothetical protein JHK82_024683 [Glycine max]
MAGNNITRIPLFLAYSTPPQSDRGSHEKLQPFYPSWNHNLRGSRTEAPQEGLPISAVFSGSSAVVAPLPYLSSCAFDLLCRTCRRDLLCSAATSESPNP